MTREQIKEKKLSGDYRLAAQMLGFTRDTVQQSFLRPRSKKHKLVCEALTKIILKREELLK
ncbi:MAG: hypothetical protein ACOCWM_03025 [Cyclobacteriaceae bacterium]